MSEQTEQSTYSKQLAIYGIIEEYLMQAQALNLALRTSSDVHEQMKPVCGIMSDLLKNIDKEVSKLWDECNSKKVPHKVWLNR